MDTRSTAKSDTQQTVSTQAKTKHMRTKSMGSSTLPPQKRHFADNKNNFSGAARAVVDDLDVANVDNLQVDIEVVRGGTNRIARPISKNNAARRKLQMAATSGAQA